MQVQNIIFLKSQQSGIRIDKLKLFFELKSEIFSDLVNSEDWTLKSEIFSDLVSSEG